VKRGGGKEKSNYQSCSKMISLLEEFGKEGINRKRTSSTRATPRKPGAGLRGKKLSPFSRRRTAAKKREKKGGGGRKGDSWRLRRILVPPR